MGRIHRLPSDLANQIGCSGVAGCAVDEERTRPGRSSTDNLQAVRTGYGELRESRGNGGRRRENEPDIEQIQQRRQASDVAVPDAR